MGIARLAIYLIGLVVVVAAAWIFLTQTEWGQQVPGGLALALILLIVGIGVMASASQFNDRRETRRIVHDAGPAHVHGGRREVVHDDVYEPRTSSETFIDERRYD